MNQLRRPTRGFTIIELVLVLVVVCALVALIVLTANGVKATNRNGERQTSIDTLRGQLEGYYAQTSRYPSLTQLNDQTWRAKHLPRLTAKDLQDPRWNSGINACTKNGQAVMASQPAPNCYSYQATTNDGAACDNDKTVCAHYTLRASLEGNETYTKRSLN